MKGSGLTVAARPAVWTIAACCCLSLSACSGTAPGAQSDATTGKAIPRASQKFCQQMDDLLDSLDSHGLTHSMTLTDARTDVDAVMNSAIADFRAFKRKSDKASSVSQLMADSTHRSPVQTRPYLRVLAYAGRAC